MKESEYIVVSNKSNLAVIMNAMRCTLPGYGIPEDEYDAVWKYLYGWSDATWKRIAGTVEEDES